MKEGSILIFPTDTVYGMGARLEDKKAYDRIYEIKKRDREKMLPILISSINDIKKIATFESRDFKIMECFWPGPLTVILETSDSFFKKTGFKTIALRMPNHIKALKILKKYGPIWTTSVNDSGEKELNDFYKIKEKYKKIAYKIYKDKFTEKDNYPSTVVDLTTDDIKILRDGIIKKEDIINLLKEI